MEGGSTSTGSTFRSAALHYVFSRRREKWAVTIKPRHKDLGALLLPASRPPALVSLCFPVNVGEKKKFYFLWMRFSKGAWRSSCCGARWPGWLNVTLFGRAQGPGIAPRDWRDHAQQQVLTLLQESEERPPTLAAFTHHPAHTEVQGV